MGKHLKKHLENKNHTPICTSGLTPIIYVINKYLNDCSIFQQYPNYVKSFSEMISKGTRSPHFSKRHHCLCSQLSDYIYNQTKRNFSEQLTGLENQLEPHFFPYPLLNDARIVRERKRAEKEK